MNIKIISDKQFRFLKDRSTNDALNLITWIFLYNNVDINKPVIAAFLDLAKAFDTVNHNKLQAKLEVYSIRGNTSSYHQADTSGLGWWSN